MTQEIKQLSRWSVLTALGISTHRGGIKVPQHPPDDSDGRPAREGRPSTMRFHADRLR